MRCWRSWCSAESSSSSRWSRNWSTYPSRGRRISGWPLVASRRRHHLESSSSGIVWGSFHEPGVAHDERAYLLQAEIFARGHWTAPSPPIAAFFEQMHVFIEPAVFAKYPPAHALTLVPGMWLGLPGTDARADDRHRRRARVLAREAPGERVDRAAHLVAVDDGVGDLDLVGVVLLRDHEHGDVADCACGRPSAGWIRAARAYLLCCRRRARMGIHGAAADDGGACAAVGLRDPAADDGDRGMEDDSPRRLSWAPRSSRSARCGISRRSATGGSIRIRTIRASTSRSTSRASAPIPRRPLRPLVPEIAAVGEWSRDRARRATRSRRLPPAFAERLIGILVWCTDGWRLALGALILAAALRASGVERAGVVTIALAAARVSHVRAPADLDRLLPGSAADLLFPRRLRARPRHPQVRRQRRGRQRRAGRRRRPTRHWRSRSCCCRSA